MIQKSITIDEKKYHAIHPLAEEFGVNSSLFGRWRKKHMLREFVKIGNRFYYSKEEIKALILHGV